MKDINISPKIPYLTTIIIFVAIVLFFTAIYPQSMDEFRFYHDNFTDVFKQIKTTFYTDAPRFTNIVYIFLLHFNKYWKFAFSILNPFIQLFIIFGLFFVATGRKINFKTKNDFYPFLLLILLYLFVSPKPSHILFWMAGVMNYSWTFVPSLILLCLFRQTIDGKELKSSVLSNFLMTFCGFATGMSNENTGPMMLGLTILFLIYCKYKKIKIPNFYYFALVGIILGISAMFGSGASFIRAKKEPLEVDWTSLPPITKMLLFVVNFNRFLAATLWLPVINALGLLILLIDNKSKIIKDKNFLLSSLFCACGFALAFALFMAPAVSIRAFYSGAMFFFISFCMLLFIVKDIYKVNLFKYLAITLFIFGIVISPLIFIPHWALYTSNNVRQQTIAKALKEGKKEIYVNRLTTLKGPTENLSPLYYDILWPFLDKKLEHDFKIKIRYEYNKDLFTPDLQMKKSFE